MPDDQVTPSIPADTDDIASSTKEPDSTIEPISTISAQIEEKLPEQVTLEATVLDKSEELPISEASRPEPSVLADEPKETTPSVSPEAAQATALEIQTPESTTSSPSVDTSVSTSPSESSHPITPEPAIQTWVEATPSSDLRDLSDPTNLPPTLPQVDINVQPPPEQVTQVQSEVPMSFPSNPSEQSTSESAAIKPEPPQHAQEVPLAAPAIQTTQKSFGDLLSGDMQPSSTAPSSSDVNDLRNIGDITSPPLQTTVNPSHTTTFGDLLKDIKPTDIPPDLFTIKYDEPPVSSTPQTQPPPTSSTTPTSSIAPISPQTSISPSLPQSPNSSDISDLSNISQKVDEKLKTELASRRQKANQARSQRRAEAINQLTSLVKSRGKLTSRDAQLLMHLPQSTLGDYFRDLVKQGAIKKFGRGTGMYYTL